MKTAALLVVAALASAAHGDLLKPNGEFPGGVESVTSGGVTVRAFRTSYVDGDDPAGLDAALRAQNFNWTGGGSLNGDLRLDMYTAWADTRPSLSFFGFTIPEAPLPGSGGAAIALGYAAGNGDPLPENARWLQLIRTNRPADWGLSHGVGMVDDVGYTWYIDNGWTGQGDPPTDPFYGGDDNDASTGYAANGRGFVDGPARPLEAGTWWEAWCFISTRDARGNLTIYDGVHWGFEMTAVPTPGTLALLAAGLLAHRRRR